MKKLAFLFILSLGICLIPYAETTEIIEGDIFKLHVIQSKKIQEIMQRLSLSLYEDELTMEQINELFDTSTELLIAAKNLNQALPGIELTVTEKNVFENVAKQLQIEANNMGYMAQNNDKEGLQMTYQRLQETCIACHELFRF
ncbi:MAG: cytochrome c [Proteobacteria bacterium]|nr:hypothetical protein [Pseudomonadota bacterium]NOG60016.1 cytochrome c [Pseudomonadota bacterium]